ncbi:MAG: pirin family protein [Halobacteriales archaeon]|nr:pirin family protein [Halobacteriales archaeon]
MLSSGIQVRRSEERGVTRTDWLLSRHSFSFGEYRDERHVGVGPLRVLNDDVVQGGRGFGEHPHRDMEIVSYVLDGAMEHRDSEGNQHVIRAGEVQLMRAGTGVEHSETNASPSEPVRFLQIWLVPRTLGQPPAYDQRKVEFPAQGGWATLASPGGEMGGLGVGSDAVLLAAKVPKGQRAGHVVHSGRQAYVFVIAGSIGVGGDQLRSGDAALVRDGIVGIRAAEDSHVLLFDLPR